jgi:riboflavin biosynthesis pyrimidine reductase
MAASIDGRIVTDAWPSAVSEAVRRQYEETHESYDADGWICGRVTMQPFAGAVRSETEVSRQRASGASREDFVAESGHDSFAFAVDASGRLAWASNEIGGDHVVAILSERVPDEYLAFLRERRVSYLLAGSRDVDLTIALEKIAERFGVQTLMLEGGGRINGAMLRAGLVDEISLLIAPAADGTVGTPSLFDVDSEEGMLTASRSSRRLELHSVERQEGDVLWLRYRVKANN